MPHSEPLLKQKVLTPDRENISRLELPVLLGAFILLALSFSVIVPLGEAPDEVPHFAYVQYLAKHQRMPPHEGAVLGESFQPPLYYAVGALATFWIPQDDWQVIANPDYTLADPQAPNLLLHTRREAFPFSGWSLAWHLVRVLSVAMGAATVWATWKIARSMFPSQRWIALGATSFVAFLPEFLVVRAAVNNDNLTVMLVSLGVLQNIRLLHHPESRYGSALLGMLLGLAVLSKLSGLVVWFFTAAIFFYRSYRTREWKRESISAAVCFGVALAILLPWMLYEQITYGDPLGWSVILSTTPVRQTPISFADAVLYLRGLFTGFWGRFGGMVQIEVSGALYAILGALGLLSLVGWLVYARDALHSQLESNVRSIFVLTVAFWIPLLVSHIRFSLDVLGTDQGRQLFLGLPLLAPVLVVGLSRILGKFAAVVWGGGLLVLSLAVMVYLYGTYSPPVVDPSSRISLGGIAAPVSFGERIRVMDYRIEETSVAPGKPIHIRIYWQALNDPDGDYWLLLKLVGKDGTVATKEGVPSSGRVTTDWWQKGQIFFSRHTLQVPPNLTAGTYSVYLGLHPFGRWDWLPARGQDMSKLDTIQVTDLQ